jgi:Kef-type K+ transport system membrane component KefB
MASVFFPAFFIAQVSKKRALKMSFFLNTRGTMEIVLATELYKLALLSPEVFVAVIIMTIICTALTVPGVYAVWWRYPEERESLSTASAPA